MSNCKHEFDDTKPFTFIKGLGYRGLCKHCGKEMIFGRFIRPLSKEVQQRNFGKGKQHMSKKERLSLRRQENKHAESV